MREYYVAHSKYKSNDRKSWENVLTFVPESTLKKSQVGTYNYYHNGELVWSIEDSIKLFNDYADGAFFELDFDEAEEVYPVWKKYSDSCEEYNSWRY